MRAKTEKRIKAERLRAEEGLSYSDISELIGVSKSTLSAWLRHIQLTEKQQDHLTKKMEANRASFALRAWGINRERFIKARQRAIQEGKEILSKLPNHKSIEELSLAMLYLGEGSKSYGRVQIASTDANILYFFLTMLKRLYNIDEKRLRFRVNLVTAAHSQEYEFISWWKNVLNYPNARFLKTQYDPRSHTEQITGNYHGVCTITYYDTYLQQKILSLANGYISICASGER